MIFLSSVRSSRLVLLGNHGLKVRSQSKIIRVCYSLIEAKCSLLLSGLLDSHSYKLSSISLGLLFSGLLSSSLSLSSEFLLSDFLLLHFVDGFNEDSLVLELVTLGAEVEVVIDVLGDLLGLSVLSEESSEHSLSSHPDDLFGHSSVSGTSSLTVSGVSAQSLSCMHSLYSGSGMHMNLSLHDDSVLEKLSNVLS